MGIRRCARHIVRKLMTQLLGTIFRLYRNEQAKWIGLAVVVMLIVVALFIGVGSPAGIRTQDETFELPTSTNVRQPSTPIRQAAGALTPDQPSPIEVENQRPGSDHWRVSDNV